MYRKFMCRVVALAGLVGLLTVGTPASWGEPEDPNAIVVDSPTMALTDLGYGSTLAFYTLLGAQQLTLPVLHGLTPAALNATVVLPVNLRSGLITVSQDDREIARLNLPDGDQTPIVIPLTGATVVDDWVTVTLRAYLVPLEGYCLDYTSPLQLTSTTVNYTGIEQPPVTVAHFLPPVLRKLTIFVPKSPSTAESDTTVRLAAAAAANYGQQSPQIVVLPLAEGQAVPSAPPGPLERQIVVKEGSDSGLSLHGEPGMPWLLISGELGAAAKPDIALLFGNLSRLALAPKAAIASLKSELQLPGNTTTLRELGRPSLSGTALRPRLSIAVDQTRFGRSVHAVRVHLLGSYTPTAADIGGQLVATIGTETIDRWPTDGHGVIDRWIEIPDRLLQRYTSLDLVLDIAGNTGRCGDFYTPGPGDQLPTLTIDGDTTVQSSPAVPAVPDGLRSVPQALMPEVQLGIEPRSLADTQRAVSIVVGLQRISSQPIETTVTSVQQAIDSAKPAILIAADGWNHDDIALPVSAAADGPITVNAIEVDGKPATLTLDPALRLASLQTVFNRGRSLLIATSTGAPGQLDELLRWLGGDTNRWPGLRGFAVVSTPGHDPVMVDRPNAAIADSPAATERHAGSGWLWWFGGAWIAAAAIGAAVILLRNRRESSRRR